VIKQSVSEGSPPALDECNARKHCRKVQQPHFDSKAFGKPLQFASLLRFSDASLLAKLLWPFPKHMKAVSSSSGNSACGTCKLVVTRICAHKYRLETKLVVPPFHRIWHLKNANDGESVF
jgi:hypothetical protein